MPTYQFFPGDTPILMSMPHVGLAVPAAIRERFCEQARTLPDTDWHVDRLYDWVHELGIGVIAAVFSRYVIDLNRPPDNTPLYSGASTGLCPVQMFDGMPLYRPGHEPDAREQEQRLLQYWQPYHQKLTAELESLKQRFGHAILFDAHSICSLVPRLFSGRLADFNLGSNDGSSADPTLVRQAWQVCRDARAYTSVLNGRFKGGYITRHYGSPTAGVHAIQLELSQRTYMEEAPPYSYREDLAEQLSPVLRQLLTALLDWSHALSSGPAKTSQAEVGRDS